jgi:beta-glucosidase-like glycosyl hydrolase
MKPIIFGFSGTRLTDEERNFFLEHKPAGYIIFKRNIESKEQLSSLVSDLKSLTSDSGAAAASASSHHDDKQETLILIDQEGGRVQRLTEPHTKKYPAPETFSKMVEETGLESALKACYDSNFAMASELAALGINVNCTPVADVKVEGAHDVIGDRSFGYDEEIVTLFCKQVIKAHMDARVMPVIKHIPGHGRAICDSHKELPRVSASLEELESTDFKAFKNLAPLSPFAMSAHIVFDALDTEKPATQSKTVINYIREVIGFTGKIITDCITMEALSGDFAERATASHDAGCDYILHCSGKIEDMIKVAGAIDHISTT